MKYEAYIVAAARSRTTKKSLDREEVDRLADEYELACRMSLGPDPERSKHWERKAKELVLQIDRIGRKIADECDQNKCQ
ncbi:MAG: hypothetical protein ACREQ5_09070 [Candidatus Dormibacteria bacterium]